MRRRVLCGCRARLAVSRNTSRMIAVGVVFVVYPVVCTNVYGRCRQRKYQAQRQRCHSKKLNGSKNGQNVFLLHPQTIAARQPQAMEFADIEEKVVAFYGTLSFR